MNTSQMSLEIVLQPNNQPTKPCKITLEYSCYTEYKFTTGKTRTL